MTEETEQSSQNHSFGPGALLKQTREQQGLSLEEVSTRLKLTLPVLKKIEADDYEGDLPATFYRGYLKNYAELLEIEDVDIGANFREYCQKNSLFSTPPPKLQGLELEKPVNSGNWIFKAATTAIILALLFAIYYVVVEKQLWKKFVPSDQEEQTISSDSLEPSSNNSSKLSIDNTEGAEQTDTGLNLDSNATSNDELAPEQSLEQDPDNSAAEGELRLGEHEDSSAVETSQDSIESGNQVATEQPAMGALSINFTGDCWVRIQDASGKVLALGIKSAGTSLQLSGETPYHLTLGKASAVQLTYDGNMVDLSSYPDTRAAKLTLGDDA